MSPPRAKITRVTITDTVTGESQDTPLGEPIREGWYPGILGWSVGGLASEADIKLDEPLESTSLGIYFASNHILLWGKGARFPEISFADYPDRSKADTGGGEFQYRFDGATLKIGRHVLRLRA